MFCIYKGFYRLGAIENYIYLVDRKLYIQIFDFITVLLQNSVKLLKIQGVNYILYKYAFEVFVLIINPANKYTLHYFFRQSNSLYFI